MAVNEYALRAFEAKMNFADKNGLRYSVRWRWFLACTPKKDSSCNKQPF